MDLSLILTILIIGVIVYFLLGGFHTESGKRNDEKGHVSYYKDYEPLQIIREGKCPRCEGKREVLTCLTCRSSDELAFIDGSEYSDPDIYCENCRNNQRVDDNVDIRICEFCNGTGVDPYRQ